MVTMRAVEVLLPLAQPWSMSVVPRRFDKHTTEVSVAGLGDGAAPILWAAPMLGRNHAGVTHDLSCTFEADEGAELGRESDRGDLVDAAQRLKRIDQCSKMDGSVRD